MPGFRAGSTSGRPVTGSRPRNTVCVTNGLPSTKRIGPVAALEKPQVSVARHVDESFDRPAVALIVDEDRRRHFIPVPRLVRVVLEVSLDLSGRDVDRNRRCDVEVVAGTLIAHPGTTVAGSPVREVGFGIVVAGHPYGRTAGLPLIALRPRLAAGFAGRRHRERPPQLFTTLGIECRDEPADAELAARGADHDLAARHERCERDVVRRLVVGNGLRPHLFAGSRVERDEHGFGSRVEHLVAVQSDTAVRVVEHEHVLGTRTAISPQHLAGHGIQRHHLVVGRRDEHHAAVDDRRRLVDLQFVGRNHPHLPKAAHVVAVDLSERTESPAVVGPADHQPVLFLGLRSRSAVTAW